MNGYVTNWRLLCCAIAFAFFGAVAHAEDQLVVTDKNKQAKIVVTEISDADAPPLIPVPEPSTVSLILLSAGGCVLAMKLRKRA